MLDNKAMPTGRQATAAIDKSVKMPDFFSCRNCKGYDGSHVQQPGHPLASEYGWVDTCTILREEGRCRVDMLQEALRTGAIQIHIGIGPGVGQDLPAGRHDLLALGR